MLSKFTKILPRLAILAKQNKATFATLGSKNLSQQNVASGVGGRDNLQFGKDNLLDFGDLPVGQIPEALKFDRPVGKRKSLFWLIS